MPIFLFLGLLASAASTRQDDSAILITGGWADATYDYDNDEGLILSSTEVLGDSCPVPSLPLPLYGHSTFLTADGLILTCEGIGGDFSDNIDCFTLDTSSQSWLPHSTLPTSFGLDTLSVSVPTGTGVFLLGGYDDTSVFLPTGSTEWQDGPKLPGSASGTCAVAISASKFLVIGGGSDPNQVEEFDTVTSTWTSWPTLNEGRRYHSCMRAGNNVVVAGGMGLGGQVLASTTILSIEDKSQKPGGDLSLARSAFQMVSHEKKLLAIGGDQGLDSGDYGGPGVDSVEEWNETTEEWTARDDLRMDTNRLLFGAVVAPRSAVCATFQ